jgi:MYXO-CTERM domain-containing protein
MSWSFLFQAWASVVPTRPAPMIAMFISPPNIACQCHLFLTNADLTNANLTGADLEDADLAYATLTGATLTGANLHQALLPSAMPSLPVINGAVVTVVDNLAVSGAVQVDTGGILSVTSDSFNTTSVNMQGGSVYGAIGLDLDQIGDVSGHGRLFGDVDLGSGGAIAGSGAGLELFGHVSGSGTLSGATVFGNLDIGSSPGAITLEDVTLSASGTTTFEVAGTDASQFDRLTLVGSVALDGTAQISFDSFTPDPSDTFQLIDLTSGTASNWFSSVVAPTGWTLSTGGLLTVPEPATLILALLGLVLLPLRRRR